VSVAARPHTGTLNRKTADALKINMPMQVLVLADEVIE
jgi:hypothetical protein